MGNKWMTPARMLAAADTSPMHISVIVVVSQSLFLFLHFVLRGNSCLENSLSGGRYIYECWRRIFVDISPEAEIEFSSLAITNTSLRDGLRLVRIFRSSIKVYIHGNDREPEQSQSDWRIWGYPTNLEMAVSNVVREKTHTNADVDDDLICIQFIMSTRFCFANDLSL